MSFEIYVQCFEHGIPAGVSRDRVIEMFGAGLQMPEPTFWRLHFPDQHWCDIGVKPLAGTEGLLHSVCVHRPLAYASLWDALYRMLGLGHVVLYWPGTTAPLVAEGSVTEHMPASMVEALGRPVCVHSGEEIRSRVESA